MPVSSPVAGDASYIGCYSLSGLPPDPFTVLIDTSNATNSAAAPSASQGGPPAVVQDTLQACSSTCLAQSEALFAFREGRCACGWIIPDDSNRVADWVCADSCDDDASSPACAPPSSPDDEPGSSDRLIWAVHYSNFTGSAPPSSTGAGASSSLAPPTASPTVPASAGDGNGKAMTWLIPVAVVALVLFLAAMGLLGWWCIRHRSAKRRARDPLYPAPEQEKPSRRGGAGFRRQGSEPTDGSEEEAEEGGLHLSESDVGVQAVSTVAVLRPSRDADGRRDAEDDAEAKWLEHWREPSALSHSHAHTDFLEDPHELGAVGHEEEEVIRISARQGSKSSRRRERGRSVSGASTALSSGLSHAVETAPTSTPARAPTPGNRIKFQLGAVGEDPNASTDAVCTSAEASARSSYHHLGSLSALAPVATTPRPPMPLRSTTEPNGRLSALATLEGGNPSTSNPPSPSTPSPPRRSRSSWLRLSRRSGRSDRPVSHDGPSAPRPLAVRRLRTSFGIGQEDDDDDAGGAASSVSGHGHGGMHEGPMFLSDHGHYPSLATAREPDATFPGSRRTSRQHMPLRWDRQHEAPSSLLRSYSEQGHGASTYVPPMYSSRFSSGGVEGSSQLGRSLSATVAVHHSAIPLPWPAHRRVPGSSTEQTTATNSAPASGVGYDRLDSYVETSGEQQEPAGTELERRQTLRLASPDDRDPPPRHPVYPSLPLAPDSVGQARTDSSFDSRPDSSPERPLHPPPIPQRQWDAEPAQDLTASISTAADEGTPPDTDAEATSRRQSDVDTDPQRSFVVTRTPRPAPALLPAAPGGMPFWRSRLNSVGSFGTAVLAEEPQTLSITNPDTLSETRSIASSLRGPRLPTSSMSRPSRLSGDHPPSPAPSPRAVRNFSPSASSVHDSPKRPTSTISGAQ